MLSRYEDCLWLYPNPMPAGRVQQWWLGTAVRRPSPAACRRRHPAWPRARAKLSLPAGTWATPTSCARCSRSSSTPSAPMSRYVFILIWCHRRGQTLHLSDERVPHPVLSPVAACVRWIGAALCAFPQSLYVSDGLVPHCVLFPSRCMCQMDCCHIMCFSPVAVCVRWIGAALCAFPQSLYVSDGLLPHYVLFPSRCMCQMDWCRIMCFSPVAACVRWIGAAFCAVPACTRINTPPSVTHAVTYLEMPLQKSVTTRKSTSSVLKAGMF